MNKIEIYLTSYDDINSSTNGGVIHNNNENAIISIKYSSFSHCSAPKYGGCIYSIKGSINIKNTLFSKCSIAKAADQYFGNVLCIPDAGKLICEHISSYLCGESESKGGDSSIHMKYSYHKILFYNASNNFGILGASLLSSWGCIYGSYIKYVQDVSSHDHYVFESLNKPWSWYYANVISCTCKEGLIYSSPQNMIDFYNCLFIDSTQQNLFNNKCKFYNCFSNNGFSSYMTTISSLAPQNVFYDKLLTCKRNHSSHANNVIIFAIIVTLS